MNLLIQWTVVLAQHLLSGQTYFPIAMICWRHFWKSKPSMMTTVYVLNMKYTWTPFFFDTEINWTWYKTSTSVWGQYKLRSICLNVSTKYLQTNMVNKNYALLLWYTWHYFFQQDRIAYLVCLHDFPLLLQTSLGSSCWFRYRNVLDLKWFFRLRSNKEMPLSFGDRSEVVLVSVCTSLM